MPLQMVMTHRKRFLKAMGLPEDTSLSLHDISNLTGIPYEALQIVYNRGIGAWKTNPESVRLKFSFEKKRNAPRQSRISKEAWAFGRVYSFIMGGKTFQTTDSDVAEKFGVVDCVPDCVKKSKRKVEKDGPATDS